MVYTQSVDFVKNTYISNFYGFKKYQNNKVSFHKLTTKIHL